MIEEEKLVERFFRFWLGATCRQGLRIKFRNNELSKEIITNKAQAVMEAMLRHNLIERSMPKAILSPSKTHPGPYSFDIRIDPPEWEGFRVVRREK